MCRRVGESESSRASPARAVVGSPPGQCRQSNYPPPFPLLSFSLFLSPSQCMPSVTLIFFSLSLSLFIFSPSFSSSTSSYSPLLLVLMPHSRVRFYSLLSRFPLSSVHLASLSISSPFSPFLLGATLPRPL